MSLKMTSIKFVPPAEDKKLPRYASYSAGVMKTHGSIGAAKNSLNNRMWTHNKDTHRRETHAASILEMVDGEYYTLYEIPAGSTFETLPWVDEYYRTSWGWNKITEYELNSSYYGPKLANGEYARSFRATPLSTDEYVNWRIAVERERVAKTLTLATFRDKQVTE